MGYLPRLSSISLTTALVLMAPSYILPAATLLLPATFVQRDFDVLDPNINVEISTHLLIQSFRKLASTDIL